MTPSFGLVVRFTLRDAAATAAFDAHEQQPHVRHFLAEREKYVSKVEVAFLELVDGKL
ncbi:hypothetical protein [Streptomyces sp. NPDC001678]|uniref:hypothetical protein n=1 Tax=Streptomyces sp. NPDC001678 TaxID=3364599 RepID=UPI0036AB161A